MSALTRFTFLFLLVFPLFVRAETPQERLQATSPWDVVVRNREIAIDRPDGRRDGFSHHIFVPVHIPNLLAPLDEQKRRNRIWNLLLERETAAATLRNISENLWWVYVDRGTVRPENAQFMTEELANIRRGKYPGVMTTTYGDSFDIHEVVFVAPATSAGTPTERFLAKNNPNYASPARGYRIEPTEVVYIPPTGKREVNEEISRVLSKIPRVTGSAVELVKRMRNPESPYDFTLEQISDLIAYEMLFWSQTGIDQVPQELRDQIKPLSEPLLSEVLALKRKYPELPDEILFPEKQLRVVIEEIVFATGSEKLLRLFRRNWGIFPDYLAHQYGKAETDIVYVGSMRRQDFARTTLARLATSRAALVVESGQLLPSRLDPADCYTLHGRIAGAKYANQFVGMRVGPPHSYRRAPGDGIIYRTFKSVFGSPNAAKKAWMEKQNAR